jgi:hypothetical protein
MCISSGVRNRVEHPDPKPCPLTEKPENIMKIKTRVLRIGAFIALALVVGAADLLAAKGPQPSICTRSCWGARAARSVTYMSALTRAIIHHTAGNEYNTTSYTASKSYVRAIQNMHMDSRGWSDIAYHFLTDKYGYLFEGRGGSMASLPRGSHDGYNYNSFGFNVMGYYHSPYYNTFTSASKTSLQNVIAWRMPSSWSPYGSGTYNGNTVGYLDGHYKVKSTACPGSGIIPSIPSVRDGVNARKQGGSTPSGPSSLAVAVVSSSQLKLTWVDNSGIESGFKIERSLSSGSGFTQIATVGVNVRAYTASGLASGTRYYFRVRAYNAIGNSPYSNTASGVTKDTIPAAPTSLTATAVSDVQINLGWAQAMPNEDGFRIYRSTDGTNFTQVALVGINATSYANTGLTGNRRYWYRVYAYNTAGNSAASNTANDITAPQAPSALTVTTIAGTTNWNKLELAWTDNSSAEVGFKIERGTAAAGPFTQIATNAASDRTYTDSGLAASTTYYYRVRSYNANGNSVYSAVVSRATPNAPPVLSAIGNKTILGGQNLAFTVTSSDPNAPAAVTSWSGTFEGTTHGTMEQMFRKPNNSGSTSAFMDTSTNYSMVSTGVPTGMGGTKAVKLGWGFKSGYNDIWARITTLNAPTFPNLTIGLDQQLQFKFRASHSCWVGIGVRESGTTAAYGANGGTTGAIEWVGVTNSVGGVPLPTKFVPINTSTTLVWNIPFEPQLSFSAGNGQVDQSGAKGTLEHIIIKGSTAGGVGMTGPNVAWIDDVAIVTKNYRAFSLDAGAPAGATIGRRNGKFSWTPTTAQVGTHTITVRVTDNLGAQDFETITVTVTTSTGNNPPTLAAIGAKSVNEASALAFTATATDPDAGQVLTFTLDAGAPAGATISTAGAFSWTPTEAQGPGTYPVTVRVTDNGSPTANDFETVSVTVREVNTAPALAAITDKTVAEGSALAATASATDADVPGNSITYSLLNAPAGMTIGASSGAIAWTPGEADGGEVYQITVRAADNGVPSLNSTVSFNVTVTEANTTPVLTLPTSSTKVNHIAMFDDSDDEANGVMMFRQPTYSSTSSSFLDASPNTTLMVTSPSFPLPDDNTSLKVLQAAFSFKTGTVNPWLRLTTFTMNTNHAFVPNPTLNLGGKLRFKIYADKSIKLAIAVRETGFNAPIGFNGGVTGTIEYLGASGKQANGCPIPTRTIAAGSWSTVEFNLPTEPIATMSGNGILATGKGTLEHLVIVPNGGMGAYNVFVDDFEVVETTSNFTVDTLATLSFTCTATDADAPGQDLSFSLDANAPTNALIDEVTGVFTWRPTAAESPSTNVFTIRVTDSGTPALSDAKNITVIVNKVNTMPYFGNMPDEETFIANSEVFSLDVEAGDDDMPGDTLAFTLLAAPSGATIDSAGVITWTAPASGASTNTFTVRVQDNGSPVLFTDESFKVIVSANNNAPVLTLGSAKITESVVTFETFTNNTPNEMVMFKKPANSLTTSSYIDTAATNYTTVTTAFPAGNTGGGAKVLKAAWTFKTGITDYWVRLTTFNTTFLPNPTIDLGARVKFNIYSDKALKVGLGVRETATAAEIGANGGSTGAIEYVGVASKIGTTPVPTRSVAANTWTTLEFNLPAEPVQTLTGDGVLASGKGVLEHLVLKAEGGTGAYTVYVDTFQVITTTPVLDSNETNGIVELTVKAGSSINFTATAVDTDPVTFGLESGAPTGAAITSGGAFSWTPGTGDVGLAYDIGVYVQDSPTGAISKRDSDEFVVNVVADTVAVQSASNGVFVKANETVVIPFGAVPGQTYSVLVAGADGQWRSIGEITAQSDEESVEIANSDSAVFCRIVEAVAVSAGE